MVSTRVRARAANSKRAAGALISRSRLLLAGKTAAAAAVAWLLAPLIPFASDEYTYYAPLGVVVSMYPTLADSARSGLQTLLGLAAGIALGLGAVGLAFAGVPAVVLLAAVVAIGVLLGGLRVLGPGREWITMAALFVLLIGGRSDPDMFGTSYLVTMAFGMIVGVATNLLIAPPTHFSYASRRLSVLRDDLSECLSEMADAVAGGALDPGRLEQAMTSLSETLGVVADEVREADLSRRGNPRGRRSAPAQEENARRLRALERTVFFTRDLADVLMRLPEDDPALRGDARERLADAIRACRDLVATAPGDEEAAGRLGAAETAVENYLAELHPGNEALSSVAEQTTAAVCLRRIVDASRPFV